MGKRNNSAKYTRKTKEDEYIHKVNYSKYTKKPKKKTQENAKRSNSLFTFLLISMLVFAGLMVLGVFSPNNVPSDDVTDYSQEEWETFDNGADGKTVLLYSSPDCSCCHLYVDYLRENGYTVNFKRVNNLEDVKSDLNVPEGLYSCHTAKVGGYIVEGHIPVVGINKLLEERPDIDGITLPQMPAGSPGMGGEKSGPFIVQSFVNGISTGVFIEI